MDPKVPIINGQYYQHRDGGIYRVLDKCRYTDRKDDAVAYIHCWPFEPGIWIRPLAEFEDGRFQPMTEEDAGRIVNTMSIEEGQAMVNEKKAIRKAAEVARIEALEKEFGSGFA